MCLGVIGVYKKSGLQTVLLNLFSCIFICIYGFALITQAETEQYFIDAKLLEER